MRQIENVEHAEDERIAYGKERVCGPEENAVSDLLG